MLVSWKSSNVELIGIGFWFTRIDVILTKYTSNCAPCNLGFIDDPGCVVTWMELIKGVSEEQAVVCGFGSELPLVNSMIAKYSK
ncbi:hypothetical protein GH714_016585 [Hevea brasiliensis]|uniref:Uncharacterized protein n=1 Tax=Hevea brasiliensis TaxID=3981 RepID=A0A6A6MTR9_HEVBR|nr:hypothetical protein GH714_016585 [Hevea brasiliensis]